jgi:hypothetical protein
MSYNTVVEQDPVPGCPEYPVAMNATGESVGYTTGANGVPADAVLWSETGQVTVLQDVGGVGSSEPNNINRLGYSVGTSEIAGFHSAAEPVLWSPSGAGTVLQNVDGVPYNNSDNAYAINNSGWIVGISPTAAPPGYPTATIMVPFWNCNLSSKSD